MRARRIAIGSLLTGILLLGWSQTYGPGEIYYGGITVGFSGRLTTAGTCSPATQPASGITQIQCQVPEGSAGTVELTATRSPAGAVNTSAASIPAGWPAFPAVSGWGTVTGPVPVHRAGGQRRTAVRAPVQSVGGWSDGRDRDQGDPGGGAAGSHVIPANSLAFVGDHRDQNREGLVQPRFKLWSSSTRVPSEQGRQKRGRGRSG